MAETQQSVSMVFESRQSKTFQLCQFIMATRYKNPLRMGMGERHNPETKLIPPLLMIMDGSGPPLRIFGGDYPTPDGTCIRDYVHVEDLARAHVKALEYCLAGGKSAAVNLGSGTALSVLEIPHAAQDLLGRKAPYEIASRRPGAPPRLCANAALAASLFDWRPPCSPAPGAGRKKNAPACVG